MPFAFFDWETQSESDLPKTGTLRYVLDPTTRPLLNSWAIDDGPVKLWCPDLSVELAPEVWFYVRNRMAFIDRPPPELIELLRQPDGYVVAWNCAFDRHVWQQVATPDFNWPELKIEQTLDAMAQAQASNLPGQLDWAGRMLGLGQKTLGGKAIMQRFARRQEPLPGARVLIDAAPNRPEAIRRAINDWCLYLDYSVQDTELLRMVWKCTRPLDAAEWREYWVSEKINDRGMLADLDVCAGAVQYREEESEYIKAECVRLTGGAITGPTFTAQINTWLYDQLPDDIREHMVKERDDDGNPTKITAAKQTLARVLEDIYVSDTPPEDNVVEFIELLQFGRSSSAVKFEKILNQEVDGRLTNSYVFNGAGQTGRMSSRGVQIHNLPRDKVPNELDVLDMIAARVPIEDLRKLPLTKDDIKKNDRGPTSVNALLARLIRPTFHAPDGKLMVWGDWSAIEARVNPWLANSRDAERAVLDPFRASDADPDMPDVYILNAASIFHIPADVLWERYKNGDPEAKAMRQAGKVAVLALGFLGSVGALRAMARGYGMRLSNEEAKLIVDGWRERNSWARRFGDKCEEAAFSAMRHPMNVYTAGRLKYQYAPDLMAGTLVCFLPDMRPIVYPKASIRKVEKFGKEVDAITYLNGMGYRSLWNGLMVENGTQATAASILRATLTRLEDEEKVATLVGHTHDEIICEVDEEDADAFEDRLEAVMIKGFDWTNGLPLAAETMQDFYYHK